MFNKYKKENGSVSDKCRCQPRACFNPRIFELDSDAYAFCLHVNQQYFVDKSIHVQDYARSICVLFKQMLELSISERSWIEDVKKCVKEKLIPHINATKKAN